MNLLNGLILMFCLIALVGAEGHRSRSRQTFKIFKQRRLNSDKLERRENFRDIIAVESTGTPSPTSTTSPTSPTSTTSPTSPTSPTTTILGHI